MKKFLLSIFLLSYFLITWCSNDVENSNSIIQDENINEILENIIKNHESYDDSKLFINFALLWSSVNNKWNTEYYLVIDWQSFYIDERWNLNNAWGFGGIPTTIELSKNNNGYNLVRYETAKDWNEYESSTKEMFSNEAYKIRKDGKYKFINDKTLLEQAEESFGVTIIPENKNKFECTFCDKLRYYNRTPEDDESLNETNGLYFNYSTENNWKNTIYFGSDWNFEAKGSRDEWTWTRTFWQDENTIIVLNNNSDHVYNRYIITNQTENSLNTILEIIQRK